MTEFNRRTHTDETRWFEPLRAARWPRGLVLCPRCGGRSTVHSKTARGNRRRYLCLECRRTFSDLTGTPFAQSKLPLSTWLEGLYLVERVHATTAEMARVLGIKWDTARSMQQRIQKADDPGSLIDALFTLTDDRAKREGGT